MNADSPSRMVKLNIDLILGGILSYTKKTRDESLNHFLSRLTHLHLEGRQLDDIECDLSICPNLTVIYLYDNQLSSIPVLDGNKFLTHLYLQNNAIRKIGNISTLKQLNKLYLGGNCLSVIEGLGKLEELEELYVENQDLPPGEKLLFDPLSVMAIAPTLQILNVSGNRLDTLEDLKPLNKLTHLYTTNNKLFDLKDLSNVLMNMHQLVQLELSSNPFCLINKFRDKVIIMAKSLEILDGREISETSKKFLYNWSVSKDAMKRRQRKNMKSVPSMNHFHEGDATSADVKVFHRHATVPGYVMPGLPMRKQFTRILAKATTIEKDAFSYNVHSSPSQAPKQSKEFIHNLSKRSDTFH